jgi:2-polyprenyl-3-methyl-5-hydroxy-6-metoxy-1,4-benzoquinol methylase/uncharacterized protein YbaR (Trm112 family)
MDKVFLNLLRCPQCGAPFEPIPEIHRVDSTVYLYCSANRHVYRVIRGIPRFVDAGNYANSFSFQWNKFSRVQLDSWNGTKFSDERFRSITGWTADDLQGKLVLDAGCGAGRFSEVAIQMRARLAAFDLSEAVDAWSENVSSPSAVVFQASIFSPPFAPRSFDYVYCIGVIQHTPDPVLAIRSLCKLVKPGGSIGLWIYERDWKSYVGTLGFKYTLRPLFSRLTQERQFEVCKLLVDIFFPLVWICRSFGLIGRIIMRLLPVASAHVQSLPLSTPDFKQWVLLDTFDMYSPTYDFPQKYQTVERLLHDEGFEQVTRHPHGGISVTARFPG